MSYQRTGNPVGMKYTGKSAKKIKELRTKNPLMNLVEIGSELGVSKQYVHKILKKADLHTGVPKKKKIRRCMNRILLANERYVGENEFPFFIAEIGNNKSLKIGDKRDFYIFFD